MNAKLFSIALMVSALPLLSLAKSAGVTLDRGDFVAAEKVSDEGETVLNVRLSKSGKAKLKKVSHQLPAHEMVELRLGEVSKQLRLREPIKGNSIQVGPLSEAQADKILRDFR